jgi:hypothetical protein
VAYAIGPFAAAISPFTSTDPGPAIETGASAWAAVSKKHGTITRDARIIDKLASIFFCESVIVLKSFLLYLFLICFEE